MLPPYSLPCCISPFLSANKKWRDDLRCGPQNKLPNGAAAQCNPSGAKHCCSPTAGRCGPQDGEKYYISCACPDCTNYEWGK